MKWNQKLMGGALQFVLFIGVLIALLLFTFLTLAHTHTLFGKKTEVLLNTIKTADLGISMALSNTTAFNDSVVQKLPFESQIQLKTVKEYWGIFEKYTAVSSFKKSQFTKTVLVGYRRKEQLPALYLQDHQRPMVIVGKSTITGDAYLPQQGIRPGNISGNSFYAKALVYGRQLASSTTLPNLGNELLQQINALSGNEILENALVPLQLTTGLVISNSFKAPTKVIYDDTINLSGISLTGNIIVKAKNQIIVDASSQLQDVILLAPEIILKDGVFGTLQAIASNRITVGKKCRLEYPSALVIKRTTATSSSTLIKGRPSPNMGIGSNSTIKGIVLYIDTTEDKQAFYPQIKIETNAQLWGELYCTKNLELKGEVLGTVNTSTFIALENGNIYQNHLFNGRINSLDLPKEYTGLPFNGQNHKKAIAKWLY